MISLTGQTAFWAMRQIIYIAIVHQAQELILQDLKSLKQYNILSDGWSESVQSAKRFECYCKVALLWTSHGKQPCDEIDGIMVWLDAKVSLQQPAANQTMNLDALFTFCIEHTPPISFFVLNRSRLIIIGSFLRRYVKAHVLYQEQDLFIILLQLTNVLLQQKYAEVIHYLR